MLQNFCVFCLNNTILFIIICLKITNTFAESDFATLSSNPDLDFQREGNLNLPINQQEGLIKLLQQKEIQPLFDSPPSNIAELRLLYSLLLQDRERLQWQPSHFRPLALQQQVPLSMNTFYPTQPNYIQKRMRRTPAVLKQWDTFYKTMDNLRKPRFGR